MVIFILAFLATIFIIYSLKNLFITLNNTNIINRSDNKEIECWYKYPHYYVFKSGEKINLSEYFTYEEYYHSNKERIIEKLVQLEHRLSKENTEETDYIN